MIKNIFILEEDSPSILISENSLKIAIWISCGVFIFGLYLIIWTTWKKIGSFLIGSSITLFIIGFQSIIYNRGKIKYQGSLSKKEMTALNDKLSKQNAELSGIIKQQGEELERFVKKNV